MIPLPTFLQEAFENELESPPAENELTSPLSDNGLENPARGQLGAQEALETLASFSRLLDPLAEANALWSRLSEETARGAQRYAPFFDDLEELFDLEEQALKEQLDNACDARAAWSRTPFAGVRLYRMKTGARLGSAEAYLASLQPGARVPLHRHPGEEVTMVLEGGYADDDGREHHAGSRVHSPASEAFHSLRVIGNERCLIALRLEKRFIFASPLYRLFLGLFWR